MVEAVEMATAGLGGDSEVSIDTRHDDGPLLLGPERAIPICRLAQTNPEIHQVLDSQLAAPMGLTTHGRFLVSTAPADAVVTDAREVAVLDRLRKGPLPQNEASTSGLEQRAALRLQARGLIRVATLTPTDASAIVGSIDHVDAEAAHKVATILARQTNAKGGSIAPDAETLARSIVDRLVDKSAEFVVRVALGADDIDLRGSNSLIDASVAGHAGAARVRVELTSALTAIGAPAPAYYSHVASKVGVDAIVPNYADVANAVGAVVGRVRVRSSATITQPTRGQYRVHLGEQPTYGSVAKARAAALELLQAAALAEADRAGAATPELSESWTEQTAVVNEKEIFVEGTLTVEASGRPRF